MQGDFTTAIKPARPQYDQLPNGLEVRVIVQYNGDTETVTLRRRRTTFGRGDSDVVTMDPTISRKHFQVEVTRTGVVLQDLASANGTIHRGRWVTFANLHDGDVFQAGNTRYQVAIRTTNLTPARMSAVVALDGEEAGALARLLDSDLFAVRTVEPGALLEACRMELPDLVIVEATARELTAVENLKRLPRLKHSTVVVLLSGQNASLEEHSRQVGADAVLDRLASLDALQEIAGRLATQPQRRRVNFPASLRCDGVEAHARLLELSTLSARLRFSAPPAVEPGTHVVVRLLLPNEYGVVSARGRWVGMHDDEGEVRFESYEGNGQLVIRRLLRDTPMHVVNP